MMHGPCGNKRPTNTWISNPRPYNNKSIQAKDGYPIYKRRMDGRIEIVRGMHMTNQWIVPYCPYLLTRYNCHINVEVCSGVKAIKYLYKYIYIKDMIGVQFMFSLMMVKMLLTIYKHFKMRDGSHCLK